MVYIYNKENVLAPYDLFVRLEEAEIRDEVWNLIIQGSKLAAWKEERKVDKIRTFAPKGNEGIPGLTDALQRRQQQKKQGEEEQGESDSPDDFTLAGESILVQDKE